MSAKYFQKTISHVLDESAVLFVPKETQPMTYLEICEKDYEKSTLDVGANRPAEFLLGGMRFHVVGNFSIKGGKSEVEKLVSGMGGVVLSKDQSKTITKSHSKTPFCYIVLNSAKDLERGTKGRNVDITESESERDIPRQVSGKSNKLISRGAALICREFAATAFEFLDVNYIFETSKSNEVQDISSYIMTSSHGRSNIRLMKVIDERALFSSQRSLDPDKELKISATAALKRFRKRRKIYTENAENSESEEFEDSSATNFKGK